MLKRKALDNFFTVDILAIDGISIDILVDSSLSYGFVQIEMVFTIDCNRNIELAGFGLV